METHGGWRSYDADGAARAEISAHGGSACPRRYRRDHAIVCQVSFTPSGETHSGSGMMRKLDSAWT